MRHVRGLAILWALACVLCVRGAEAADPAAVVPHEALVYVEAGPAAAQELLAMAALPPIAGTFVPGVSSPFSYINSALNLPPQSAEQAAPHLDGAAFAALDAGLVFVFAFDDSRWPASLLQGLPKRQNGTASLAVPGSDAAALARGGVLLITNERTCAQLAQGDYAALAAEPAFSAARAESAGAALWAYVPLPALIARARAAAYDGTAQAFCAFAEAAGLDRAPYALVAVRGREGAGHLEVLVPFADADAGLLKAVPEAPPDMSADLPADAAAAVMLNWGDASAFFGALRDLAIAADEVHAGGVGTLRAGLAQTELTLGLRFDELFAQLGAGAALYYPQAAAGRLMDRADWTVVLRLKDAKGFERSLGTLCISQVGVALAPMTHQGAAMFQVPGLPAFFALLSDRAVFGGSPQAVKRYLDWKADAAQATLEKTVGGRRAAALLWADLGLLLQSYPAAESGVKAVMALSRDGRQLKATIGLEDVQPEQIMKAYTRTYPALMAAMLMPALGRARGEAQKVTGRSNLHNLGLGIYMYRNDHEDKYPPDLAVVLREGYLPDDSVFVDPADAAPEPGPGGLRCSYSYVGPLPEQIGPDVIMACTRKGVHPEGRNVLSVDMAVQWVSEEELQDPHGHARTSLRASYDAVIQAFGDRLTQERKAQLRRFYEIED